MKTFTAISLAATALLGACARAEPPHEYNRYYSGDTVH